MLLLDISKGEGREVLLELMETTDIFIEASKGLAFARHGVTDEILQQHSPKPVIAYPSGFDQYGAEEYTNLPAYNTTAQAFSGYLIQDGDVDQPIPAFPYTADYLSGLTATTATLAALHKVYETDKGESIDITMYEVVLRMGQHFMMDYFSGGEVYPRMNKGKGPYYIGCGLYKRADDCIMVEPVGITRIEKCFRDIGLAHLLGTSEIPEGTQLIHRIECPYGPLVEKKFDAWLATRIIAGVKEHSAELNIACVKVLTVPELESNPQYVTRESITQWQMMNDRTCKRLNIMPRFRNSPGRVWREMPSHDMSMVTILKNIGYSKDNIQELASKSLAKVGG